LQEFYMFLFVQNRVKNLVYIEIVQ
jgi:hypothetical protein